MLPGTLVLGLEENPFQHVRLPKMPKREIHVFSEQECVRMINAARGSRIGKTFRWDLFLLTALCTGMRRGELLNLTWQDIDFDMKIIHICPKDETEFIWKWQIKDKDSRDAPITEELAHLLSEYRAQQPAGYPYVFVFPKRYDRIQKVRRLGKWSERQCNCPHGNFQRQFTMILKKAGIEEGQFHDLRRTCFSNWFSNGLREYDVMKIAGHASFETTHKFYLAIRKDLLDQARALSAVAMKGCFIADS
jgi:integrase